MNRHSHGLKRLIVGLPLFVIAMQSSSVFAQEDPCDYVCNGPIPFEVRALLLEERWDPTERVFHIGAAASAPAWMDNEGTHISKGTSAWTADTGLSFIGGSGGHIQIIWSVDAATSPTGGWGANGLGRAVPYEGTDGFLTHWEIYVNCLDGDGDWNDENETCPNEAGEHDLASLFVHEIGHALCLDDINQAGECSVMDDALPPYPQNGSCPARSITFFDKKAIACRYPKLVTDATVGAFGIVNDVAQWTVLKEDRSGYYVIEETIHPDNPGRPIHFETNGLGTHTYSAKFDLSLWYRLVEVDIDGNRKCLATARPKARLGVTSLAENPLTPKALAASDTRGPIRIHNTPDPPTCAIYADLAYDDEVISLANDWEYRFGEKVWILLFVGETSENARLIVHDDMKNLYETFGTKRFHIIASNDEIAGSFSEGALPQSAFLSSSDQELADFDYDGVPDAVVTRWLTGPVDAIISNWWRMGEYSFLPSVHGTRSTSFLVNDLEESLAAWPGSGELTDMMADKLKSVVALEDPTETIRTLRASPYPDLGDRNVAAKNHINTHKPELIVLLGTTSSYSGPARWFFKGTEVTPTWTMNLLNQGVPPTTVLAASCHTTTFNGTLINNELPVCNDFVGTSYGFDTGGAVAWMGPFGNSAHQTANFVFSQNVLAEMFAHPYRPMGDSWLAALTSSYAELGQVDDYRNTLNMMIFLGDPLTPFRCFPRIRGYAKKSGTLYIMPSNLAIVCPQDGSNHADDVVAEVAIDARDFSTALPAQDLTMTPPAATSMAFFPSTEVIADGASTLVTNDPQYPNGCYKATFTIKQSGGCGEALATVRLQEEVVGHTRIKLRSPDLNASGAVNLMDFAAFGSGYPMDPAINDCRDFNNDNKVNSVDFATFGTHNNHQTQGQIAVARDLAQSDAGVVLRITEEFPTATQHRVYVDLDVDNFSGVTASLFSLVAGDERLTFVEWLEAQSSLGTVMFAPVSRDDEEQLYFGSLTSDQFTGSDARLGRLVFDVTGSEAIEITETSFVMRTGEVLIESEAGSPIIAHMTGILDRVLDPDIVRIYHDRLEQNFPNPFNPTTTIAFSMKDAGKVSLAVYDVRGRRIRELVDEYRARGVYRVVWDGRNDSGQVVASGVYFYKLVAGSFTDTKKMTILK